MTQFYASRGLLTLLYLQEIPTKILTLQGGDSHQSLIFRRHLYEARGLKLTLDFVCADGDLRDFSVFLKTSKKF